MSFKKHVLRLLAVPLFAFSAFADLHVPFPEGERVVCVGDSITHGGMYPYYLQLAQLLRKPGSDVLVLNAGISGGSASGAIRRWGWNVRPMNGTTALVVFGMNDVNRPLYGESAAPDAAANRKIAIDRYASNMEKLTDMAASDGCKVIVATPPPFDEYNTLQKSDRSVGCNEEGLSALAEKARLLADGKKYTLVELHRPLTDILKTAGDKVYLPDRVHPTSDGHLLILRELLRSLGVSPEVSHLELSADGGKIVSRHAGFSRFKASPERISFRYEPESLPFPGLDGEREILAVKGLAEGRWELYAADVPVGTFTAGELAEGVDLAKLDTPSARLAKKALDRALTWRNADVQLRHLAKMDVRAMELGADPTDYDASLAAIVNWYEKRGRKLASAKYYAGLIETYRKSAKDRGALRRKSEKQLKELVRLSKPAAYEIAVKRAPETICAGQWTAKFYEGLEANGEMCVVKGGYKGTADCIELKYIHGADKFGAEKTFANKTGGATLWTVSADVECDGGGDAGAAIEIFDAAGKSLGVKTGAAVKADGWTRHEWKFAVPSKAANVSVHLLSLSKKSVRFANARVDSEKGEEIKEKPIEAYALPSAWNKAWNGGKEMFTSFADAPLAMSFHFKGDKDALRLPAFEIEFPDELELDDAFTSHAEHHAAETPVSDVRIVRDGATYRKLRFENIKAFGILRKSYGWERKLAVVLAPKDARKGTGRTFKIYWRALEEELVCSEGTVDLRFASVPEGLRKTDFFVFSWQSDDRLFTNDKSLLAAAKAYEAAGVTTFVRRNPEQCPRGARNAAILEKRGPWRFTMTFSDSWDIRFLNSDTDDFKALGVKMAERNDGKKMNSPLLCPDYFNNDPAFHAYYRDSVILPRLKSHGIKAGDMISGDLEPWGAKHFCVCERCLKAFAEFKGLDKIPSPREIGKWPDDWALFRCRQTETSVAKLAKIIRDYDPGIKVIDYDYIIWYGEASERMFMRGCSKNAAMNEKWIDAHICSFYHTCDLNAFNAIGNNTRKLLKPYIPLGAIAGAGSYLRGGEVRNPAQIRQLALAAAVHGCPGIGFYKGIHYDGEHLLALMKARDEIAAVEGFGWGKAKGSLTASSDSKEFAFASASRGGEEAIALFNYDAKKPLTARIFRPQGGGLAASDPVSGKTISPAADLSKGFDVEVRPGDVRFVLFRR